MTMKQELKAVIKYIAFYEEKMALATSRGHGQFFRRGRGNFLTRLDVARSRKREIEKKICGKE